MIDLHTHTILSDGELVPSELVRRAYVAGYRAIAITDHVDHSNIDIVLHGIVKIAEVLNKYWDIFVVPGVEITHVPLETFYGLASFAREKGAKVVIAHGESPVEPVVPGTNRAAINAGIDILAHPGFITREDASLAHEKGIFLEITNRNGHSRTNKHVFDTAVKTGAKLVLNTDTHSPDDLFTLEKIDHVLKSLTDSNEAANNILNNSWEIVNRIKS